MTSSATTQYLFFEVEQDAIYYNIWCGDWISSRAQGVSWNQGWDPEINKWSNIYQTSDDPLYWPEGDSAGVLGYYSCGFLGLPVWGNEMFYRVSPGGPFPLDDTGEDGATGVQYDRAYWIASIPSTAVFVEEMIPKWPEEPPEEE